MLAEKLPELLDFPKELKSLEASTKVSFLVLFSFWVYTLWKQLISCISVFVANSHITMQIQLKYLAEEMQAVSKGLEKVVQELSASENDGRVSNEFCKVLCASTPRCVHLCE